MARARNIKPGFFKNEELSEIEPLGRILFAGLWCLADREGRLEDRPKRIKAEVLPYDDCDVEKLLQALQHAKFIVRYQVDGKGYIKVLNFKKHQNPHKKEAESILPAAPEIPERASEIPERAVLIPDSLSLDSLIPDSLNPPTPFATRKPFRSRKQQGRFDHFWDKYPKKKSKGQAEKAWAKINPSEQLFTAIMDGLERAKTSNDWLKDGGKYIPYPATWLSAKGWEDEHNKEVIPGGANRRQPEATDNYERNFIRAEGT